MKRLFIIKLLLIEDSPLARKNIVGGLRKYNFEITEAGDGKTGLESAYEDNPDIILLDLNLPDIPGIEVLKKLRENEKTASIPVLITTTSNQSDDVKESLRNGALFYFVKPIEVTRLLEKMTDILGVSFEEISAANSEISNTSSRHGKKRISAANSSALIKLSPNELKAGMTLGIPFILPNGKILYKSNTVLDSDIIQIIRDNGVGDIFIKPGK